MEQCEVTNPYPNDSFVFNTKNISKLSPWIITGNDSLQFPLERLPYVQYLLDDLNFDWTCIQDQSIIVVKGIQLPLLDEEVKTGRVALTPSTPAQELAKQLKFASLWIFNYDEWFTKGGKLLWEHMQLISQGESNPGIIFLPLSNSEVDFLRILIKKKLWYVSEWSESEKIRYSEMVTKMDAIFPERGEFFLRLSGHSPKDVPNRTLKVKNGEEIMSLLVRSERVLTDLEIHKKLLYSKKITNIILIPWYPMDPKFEFRCFVYQKTLTTISQYEYHTSFQELQDVKFLKQIRESIIRFHNLTSQVIPYHSYIFDVFLPHPQHSGVELEQDKDLPHPHLIELNPFYGDLSSGSCLFEWEQDEGLLFNRGCGQELPVLRVRKEGDRPQFIQLKGVK